MEHTQIVNFKCEFIQTVLLLLIYSLYKWEKKGLLFFKLKNGNFKIKLKPQKFQQKF